MEAKKTLEFFTRPLLTVGDTAVSLMTVFQFALLIVVVAFAAGLTRRFLKRRVLPRTRLDPGLQDATARMTGYAVLVLGFMIGLSTLGFDLTSLTVLTGAVGVGIGFGLQKIVENFISGLIILGEKPIQIGHRIEVGDIAGQVVHIGARSTTILTNENITMIVPNSQFISERVVNWSHGGDRRVRISVPLGVSYGSDPRQVERILLEVARASEHVLAEPVPAVVFRGFGDSSLDFELRAWTDTLSYRPGVFRSRLYFEIWEKFKEHGIDIPFPQRDLSFRNPVRVEMATRT